MVASSISENSPCILSSRLFALKSIPIVIIFILAINAYLFYRLKSLNDLETGINTQKFEDKVDIYSEKKTPVKKRPRCKVGNYSLYMSDVVLQLKEDLDEYYLLTPNSSIVESRCHKFLEVSKRLTRDSIIFNESDLDFSNNQLVPLLKKSIVLSIKNAPKGTQLKLLARFTNNITALIKPKWYSSSDIIIGDSVAGKDRHTGEVVAFYLSILLQLTRVPPSVIRHFDLQKEIISNSDEKLLSTFLVKENKTCFYGICRYCKPSDLVCEDSKTLEASVIYYVPYTLRIALHPWTRTYRCNILPRWETKKDYCDVVRRNSFYSGNEQRQLFLDLMDVSIFDFLISNGDRHHIEFITISLVPRLIMLDNGKSFGNPHVDYIDILSPLYQCCELRKSTWINLLHFRGGILSKMLKYLLHSSDKEVQINELHLKALDRRLLIIFSTLEYCFKKLGAQNVLV